MQEVIIIESIALPDDVGRGFQPHLRAIHCLAALAVIRDAPIDVARGGGETISIIVRLHFFVGALLVAFDHVFIRGARHGFLVGERIIDDAL